MVLLTLLGCLATPREQAFQCLELEAVMGECVGVDRLPLPCDELSHGDVQTLADLVGDFGCTAFDGLLPLDGDPLAASCNLLGEGCVSTALPAVEAVPTRYPVVLVNGIDVSPLFSWSERVVAGLQATGHDVHLAVVPPWDSTPTRSAVLWERVQQIRATTGADKVDLVCHSLGGLDCRYLVSPGGLHWEVPASHDEIVSSVASITTVGTAHFGTPVADVALGFVSAEDPEGALDRLATVFGQWLTEDAVQSDVQLRSALGALSESQTRAFNAEIIDADGIVYQSWGGFSTPFGEALDDPDALEDVCGAAGLTLFGGAQDHLALPLLDSFGLVDDLSREPSDGLVPISSTKWGNFRGCIPADHMEQLGRGNLPDANVRTHIDIASFYASVAADLARQGF